VGGGEKKGNLQLGTKEKGKGAMRGGERLRISLAKSFHDYAQKKRPFRGVKAAAHSRVRAVTQLKTLGESVVRESGKTKRVGQWIRKAGPFRVECFSR